MLFVSFPFPVILIFPCGKTEESGIRSQAEKLFFLQKVFLFATSHWELANSLFKNAPCGWSIPPIAMGGQRLCLWNPPPFIKGGRKFYIRVYSRCEQRPNSTRRQLPALAAREQVAHYCALPCELRQGRCLSVADIERRPSR